MPWLATLRRSTSWNRRPSDRPRPRSITCSRSGFQQWFTEQLNAPISPYTPNAPGFGTLQSDFFLNALSGPDQLRQRVAFALSEIFVISGYKDFQTSEFEPYLQILQSDALGNFYDLMTDITLSPSMGLYLDMANNVKGVNGSLPNENYARELMQLFCTGPVLLNSERHAAAGRLGKHHPALYGKHDPEFRTGLHGLDLSRHARFAAAGDESPVLRWSDGRLGSQSRYGRQDAAERDATARRPDSGTGYSGGVAEHFQPSERRPVRF